MPRFTLINYGLSRDAIASVHRAGCRDIKRDASRHAGTLFHFEGENAEAVVDRWIDSEMQELGYTIYDIDILPCCKKA